MIEMYEILTGKYDVDVTPKVLIDIECAIHNQRQYVQIKQRSSKVWLNNDLRKIYFTNRRVVNAWNSLPDHVVLSETINTFKSWLDKFWQHQDMIYDFQAELHRIGSGILHNN